MKAKMIKLKVGVFFNTDFFVQFPFAPTFSLEPIQLEASCKVK